MDRGSVKQYLLWTSHLNVINGQLLLGQAFFFIYDLIYSVKITSVYFLWGFRLHIEMKLRQL